MRSYAARIAALEASLEAALQPPALGANDLEAEMADGDLLRPSRATFLRLAAAGAAGLAGGSVVALSGEQALGEVAPAGQDAPGIVGAWVVSIAYASGPHRTRGLASFFPGGGFVGSVSAYERAPAHPTPSRGTTLHGTWLARGRSAYAVAAVRLHMDRQGTLLGVMRTLIAATLAPDNNALDGTFTFTATRPSSSRVFSQGSGTLHFSRIAPP
jgi:hypothetical protein